MTLLAVVVAALAAMVAAGGAGSEQRLRAVLDAGDRTERALPGARRRATSRQPAGRRRRWRDSVRQGRAEPAGEAAPRAPLLATARARHLLGAVAGIGIAAVVGGPLGVVLGAAAAVGLPPWVARLPDPVEAERQRRLVAVLPLGLDLISACLAAGAPLSTAVAAVAAELPGPLSRVLSDVGRQLRLGADAPVAWRGAARHPALAPLVETVLRVGDSGAALVPALRRLAADERDRSRQEQEAAIRRVGVFVVVPLGVCFLPAFVLIGVVPIIAGLIGDLSL